MPLFNQQDLAGWHGNNPHVTAKSPPDQRAASVEKQQADFVAHWRVENGELVNDGKGPYATTDKEYGDIELILEYKTVAKADSGIYLRGTPQVQIWDWTKEGGKWNRGADKGSGGLFNNRPDSPGKHPAELADRPFGEWNEFRITQLGSRTTVVLNDKQVVANAIMENYWDKERKTPLPPTGPIHLQTHGGEIRWRNIRLREVPGDEANRKLRGDDTAQGFRSLFNGKDLTGWAGATKNYEVVDGAIACKKGKGGVLFTDKQFEDFIVRLEFLVPPGGNNGLAIRYPGKGRASYNGMCELQVLDNKAGKYAKLDARQYHGSAYGMVPAHRGYLRPAGQWNYQEVTVRGSTIRVELNGTIILDTDLAQVTDYLANRPHPGKLVQRGHFGFAGHNDPVQFRNIAIKELPTSVPAPFVARPFTDNKSFTPGIEGPACDADGNLYAVNFGKQQTIGKVSPDGKAEQFVVLPGESIGNGIRFDRQGMMYVADYTQHNVLRIDPKTKKIEVFAHNDTMNQPNDLAIAPDGTLYASDPNWQNGTGQLWRIDQTGETLRLGADLGTTNGIEVSPDGKRLYVNESKQRKIWVHDITANGIANKRLLKEFADHGFDGMRCDVEGNLYVTRYGKGTVVILTPGGEVIREVDVLGSKPSNLCFGGRDGKTVYVTEVEHQRIVSFRVEHAGAAWQRWQEAQTNQK